jgi:ABC-type phosphate transport system auxiliary subunit
MAKISNQIIVIRGIKANEEKMKELHTDYMRSKKGNKSNYEDSQLFLMHEDVTGLIHAWIGDDENPDGLIIGNLLDFYNNGEELNIEEINRSLEGYIKIEENIYDYTTHVQEMLNTDEKMKIYIVNEIFHG